MYLSLFMREGLGLVITWHHGHWYFGIAKYRSRGVVTHYRVLGSLDEGLALAVRYCRLWRRRGMRLSSQMVKMSGGAA